MLKNISVHFAIYKGIFNIRTCLEQSPSHMTVYKKKNATYFP